MLIRCVYCVVIEQSSRTFTNNSWWRSFRKTGQYDRDDEGTQLTCYTRMALILNFRRNTHKSWTSSLKFIVISSVVLFYSFQFYSQFIVSLKLCIEIYLTPAPLIHLWLMALYKCIYMVYTSLTPTDEKFLICGPLFYVKLSTYTKVTNF